MGGIGKANNHIGATITQQVGQPLGVRYGNDWIVVAGGNENANVAQFRQRLGNDRNHGAKENGGAQNFRTQQQQARSDVGSVRKTYRDNFCDIESVVFVAAIIKSPSS